MSRNAVKLIECPRDAWQGLKRQIPTELKTRYLRSLIQTGFRHIDAVSFVSPKAVPQMADSERVLEQIEVIRNTRGTHGKGVANFADGEIALLEHFEDAAASGIAEGFKEKVQWLYN